jgi:hypothetical protein
MCGVGADFKDTVSPLSLTLRYVVSTVHTRSMPQYEINDSKMDPRLSHLFSDCSFEVGSANSMCTINIEPAAGNLLVGIGMSAQQFASERRKQIAVLSSLRLEVDSFNICNGIDLNPVLFLCLTISSGKLTGMHESSSVVGSALSSSSTQAILGAANLALVANQPSESQYTHFLITSHPRNVN